MAKQNTKHIEFTDVALASADIESYCTCLQGTVYNGFWWYLESSSGKKRFSLPFRTEDGTWWYQVKPGLCWPVDVLTQVAKRPRLPLVKSYLGFQCTAGKGLRNSVQIINTIEDISLYSEKYINSKRRGKIRKGSRMCDIELIKSIDYDLVAGAAGLWNDFVKRTGWKKPLSQEFFSKSWGELLSLPGSNIMIARSKEDRMIAGFLISKLLGDTAFIDTIASDSKYLSHNVNDIMMYSFINSAKKVNGITKAHYAIKSYDDKLETFKKSIGFTESVYPSLTHLRPGVGMLLKLLSPRNYNRLYGKF
ncbi:MAG: hypothetical protein GF398_21170 [Chitinivibrionales bacterium]|nr:hypothetical protein [Chitinivibrionales bacterium]